MVVKLSYGIRRIKPTSVIDVAVTGSEHLAITEPRRPHRPIDRTVRTNRVATVKIPTVCLTVDGLTTVTVRRTVEHTTQTRRENRHYGVMDIVRNHDNAIYSGFRGCSVVTFRVVSTVINRQKPLLA